MRNDFTGVPACTLLGSGYGFLEHGTGSRLLVLADSIAGLKNLNGIQGIPFEQLTEAICRSPVPKLIIAPVIGCGFDIYDVALVLSELRFKGDLKAIEAGLPNRNIVQTEISQAFPDLRFEVLGTSGFKRLGLVCK